ncbi:MAG: NAD(P)/FAD-dependent oxidoreductase [Spirochaetales bacterium]|nr:NAD(P)/FAD-dependent oxidoreductase [Spirochaetales bacterium]
MQIVIIGNSAAGLNALESFRRLDADSAVTVVSEEPGPAYSRVLLPYYLRRRLPYERLFIRRPADYRRLGAECLFQARVERVDPAQGTVHLRGGRRLPYDRLLVATGSSPVKPPVPGLEGPGIWHLWTLADALALEPLLEPGKRVLVLGSGFVSLQAAWAALARELKVTVFELLPRIMPRVLDEPAAAVLAERIRARGVDLRTEVHTEAVQRGAGGSLQVWTRESGTPESFDLIIVGTGVRANAELILESLPEARRGIPVDARMRTDLPGVYAAGDVALGPTAYGEPHESHALWPTAVEHGKIAGQEMAGHPTDYRGSLNMNVTEMFGVTVASMGRLPGEPLPEGTTSGTPGDRGGLQLWERFDPAGPRLVRLLTREQVPVGAVVIGEAADAALLGQLRPFVRLRRPLPEPERFVAGGGVSAAQWRTLLGRQYARAGT